MFKPGTPGTNGAEIMAQFLENDKQNQAIDDTAVINTGVVEGTVVKWSSSRGKWVLCDGTVALESTDTIGVVTYANGTSGQVKTAGVYVDTDLVTLGKYYSQSNGAIGQTVTKVFIGTVTSAGRLCLPGGGGSSIAPATLSTLGGIIVGRGLRVTTAGILSTDLTIPVISITGGIIGNGGTIPLPSGYTREQCRYAVWSYDNGYVNGYSGGICKVRCIVNQSTGVVSCDYATSSEYTTEWGNGTAGYLCIGVK